MKNAPQIRALLLAMLFVFVRSAVGAQTLPSPWANTDIGAPATAGRATLSSGTFTITAAGSDIWGTSDQLHFVYQPVTGDAEILARVVSITTTAHRWSKAGVMIRESLTAESRHAMMVASAGAGYAFQRRVNTAGSSDSTAGPASAPPGWVRLVRKGDLFSAYYSTNGTSWQLVGSDTIPMGDTVYVGLPVTSHSKMVSTTAKIDSVKLIAASLPNSPPAVSVTAPTANSQYTTSASIAITATATDPEGAMLSVDFYANQTLITRDTTAPYSATFATSTPGTYSLTAVAHDADGNSTTSGAVPVSVQSPSNQAPTVSLTSPAAGAKFTAPATVNLTANATDPENKLARVEFLSGTTVVGTDTTAPYSFSWTNVPAGTYSLTAKAHDSEGASATSATVSVTVTASSGNKPPVVTFTSPANGATFSAPASIPLAATATDAEGPIARVEFYSGTTLLWTEAFLPYADSWTNVPAGTYTLTAVAYDGQGAKTTSAPVTVTVNGTNRPPTVALTSPASGSTFSAPATVSMTATASDPENQLARVEFLSGTTVLATDTAAPFTWSWSNVAAGTYTLSARAYDSAGAAATSAAVTVTVNGTNRAPTVALTSPASGATFTAPATISMTASASDPENQLARVEFLSGTTVLATDTTAPFAWSWSNVAAGSYTLTARAYDSAGASATSSAVTLTVGAVTTAPRLLVFTASADHATNVSSYRLSVYAPTANPATATPLTTSDLGKPTPDANNDITVDRATFFAALPVGNYVATVTAIGPGGQTQSSSVAFSR
jgi:regulation of enolase protein 1 (concanavalin A-like superfamily)